MESKKRKFNDTEVAEESQQQMELDTAKKQKHDDYHSKGLLLLAEPSMPSPDLAACPFDPKDNYTWEDFCKLSNTTFQSKDQMNAEIAKNAARVFRDILSEGCFEIRKRANGDFERVKNVRKTNLVFNYLDTPKEKQSSHKMPVVKQIKWFAWKQQNQKRLPLPFNEAISWPQPLQQMKSVFNTWPGLPHSLLPEAHVVDTQKISIFLEHLKIITNHNDVSFRYMLRWIRDILLMPWQKTNIMPCIKEKHTEKARTLFLRFLQAMVGYRLFKDLIQFKSDSNTKWNQAVHEQLIVHIQFFKPKHVSIIENLIINPVLILKEEKHGMTKCHSFCNLICSLDDKSHEAIKKHAGPWYFVLQVSEKYQDNDKYSDQFSAACRDKFALQHFYTFLSRLEDSDMEPLSPLPQLID